MLKHRHPAVHQIRTQLQQRIERGEYPAGTWLPTERDLTIEFAVDRAVVRMALDALAEQGLIIRRPRHRPYVNDHIRPHSAKSERPVRIATVQTIAAILPDYPYTPSAIQILNGINRALRQNEAPYRLVVFDNWRSGPIDLELERRALEAVEQEGIAGVILWQMAQPQTLPLCWRLRDKGIPIVFVDRFPQEQPCDFVGVDNRFSARQAVNHLLDLGHRRIGHLASSEDLTTVQGRAEGYREALLQRGITPLPEWVHKYPIGPYPRSGPAEYFFSLPEPPTAIFAMSDYITHFFIAEVERSGRRVPEDISIIGHDDIDRFSPRPPVLTTVQQPFDLIGERAAELLLKRLRDGGRGSVAYQHILLPTPLIVRSTCRRLE